MWTPLLQHPARGSNRSRTSRSALPTPSMVASTPTSFLPSPPSSSNSPGPLTPLPDNPDNPPIFLAAAPAQDSLNFRFFEPPDLPTTISDRMPQICIRHMQRRPLHNRTSSRVCKRSWAAEHGFRSGRTSTSASNFQPTTNHPLTILYRLAAH